MVDFHSHVLPFIDDGAKDLEESIKILEILKSQNVNTVIATPHFYDSIMDIQTFLSKRSDSYSSLINKVQEKELSLPDIKLGAEVYLSPYTAYDDDLEKLCIGESNCILIEMPSGYWLDWMYKAIEVIMNQRELMPIIAHLDRYAQKLGDVKEFKRLLELNVLVQINADSFLNEKKRRIIKKLFKNDWIHLIGSDTHNLTDRKPQIEGARKHIEKKYGAHKWDMILTTANSLMECV